MYTLESQLEEDIRTLYLTFDLGMHLMLGRNASLKLMLSPFLMVPVEY